MDPIIYSVVPIELFCILFACSDPHNAFNVFIFFKCGKRMRSSKRNNVFLYFLHLLPAGIRIERFSHQRANGAAKSTGINNEHFALFTYMWVIFFRLWNECLSSLCNTTSTDIYLK